ncbi:unnamed protein product [Rotaria magnacalcarata]
MQQWQSPEKMSLILPKVPWAGVATNETSGFRHIEFHTIQPNHTLDVLVRIYGFQIIAQRTTLNYSQWFLESYECQLLISSLLNSDLNDEIISSNNYYDILTPIIRNQTTRDLILDRDTVFNIALHVKSIQSILDKNSDVQVLVSLRHAIDEYGSIEYACIKSCIGNVVHTLIDTSQYSGSCLPGFTPVSISRQNEFTPLMIHGIDHIAFAVDKHSALSSIAWYEKIFGMKRFMVNQGDDPFQGFTVRLGTVGMRLFASEYWKCAETACVNGKKLKYKIGFCLFPGSADQITTFLNKHKGQAGIQHMGFTCTDNIKHAVRITKANGAQFLSRLADYYLQENNGRVIEEAAENISELAELGILLDNEANDCDRLCSNKRRGATGFGAGNIRNLWKIVQQQVNGET